MHQQLSMFSEPEPPAPSTYQRRPWEKRVTLAQRAEMVDLYLTPKADGTWRSAREIAAGYSVTMNMVLYYVHRAGHQTRHSLETRGDKACKPIKNLPVGQAPPCRCGCGEPCRWLRRKNAWGKFAEGHFDPAHNLPVPSAPGQPRPPPRRPGSHRPTRPLPPMEWLRREYVERLRTFQEIATELQISAGRLSAYARTEGIPIRSISESLILRGSVRGPRNGSWRGGIAKWEYAPGWKRIARQIRKRDNYTCQMCQQPFPKSSKVLHVHHIDGVKSHNAPENLVVVCASCHPKGQRRERSAEAKLAAWARHASHLHPELRRGTQNGSAKLTEAAVREIRHRSTGRYGERQTLAREFGVAPSTISQVVKRRGWKHVP